MNEVRKSSKMMFLIPILVTAFLVFVMPYWRGIELKSLDFRVRLAERLFLTTVRATGSVVLVGIEEDESIKNKPLIFWYPDIGRFLKIMEGAGAVAVALDIIPVGSLGDRIVEVSSLLMGSDMTDDRRMLMETIGQRTDDSLLRPMLEVSEKMRVIQGVGDTALPFFYSTMAFMENVHRASVRIAPDNDYIMRRQSTEYNGMDTLSHSVYRVLSGVKFPEKKTIINFSLRSSIPYYPFSDVLAGRVPLSAFNGKAVILGYFAPYADVQPTPVDPAMAGARIHAVAAETMLTGSGYREVSSLISIGSLVFMSVCGALFSIRHRPLRGGIIIVLLTGAYACFNMAMLSTGTIHQMFPHVLAPIAAFCTVYPYRYLVEEKTRRKLYRMFSYYVDPTFIDSLLEKETETLLKGDYKEMTVIFLDIRDFTWFCDHCSAEQTVRFLSVFFDRMSGVIQRHKGVVNKFIGDAVLAFFWDEQNRVVPALAAAQEMLQEVEKMCEEPEILQMLGDWKLRIGIGMHYGSVVMGNVGSDKKMDFTIIGTTVNIASRLEGANKRFKTRLIMTEEAYSMLGEHQIELACIGQHVIRGVSGTHSLYTLKTDASQPDLTCEHQFHRQVATGKGGEYQ